MTSSMLRDLGRFFALDLPFFWFIFMFVEGWSSSDESLAAFFLCLLTGASVSLALEARCRFEDFLFACLDCLDCLDCLGGGLFEDRAPCLELEGMV